MTLSRRQFVLTSTTLTGAVFGAGCQSFVQLHADVFLRNKTQTEQTISLTIHDMSGDEVFEKEINLEPTDGGEPRILGNPVERDADYTVTARTDSGFKATWDWTDVEGELRITIQNGAIEHSAATGSGMGTE